MIFAFLLCFFSVATTAAPTNSTTASPTPVNNTTVAVLPVTTPTPGPGFTRLSKLCNHNVEYGDAASLDDALIASVANGLDRFRKEHPFSRIDRCVIKVPDGTELDNEIETYNENKLGSEKNYTAFLLPGRGVRKHQENNGEVCGTSAVEVAGENGKEQESPSVLPQVWQDSFLVNAPVELEAGQKLIGIPLNIGSATLAKGYRVNLKRQTTASVGCNGSNLRRTIRNRGPLITIRQPGSGVSGLTNIDGVYDRKGYSRRCSWRTHRTTVYADELYTQLINIELNLMSLYPTRGSQLVSLSNNELFQFENSAVNISLLDQGLFSRWLNGGTFVSLRNNYIYSCFTRGSKKSNEVALNIDLSYRDAAPDPTTNHALELKGNRFSTRHKTAVNLNVSPGSESVIRDNRVISGKTAAGSSGIAISGITLMKDTAKPAPTFLFDGNAVEGFEAAIAFDGIMRIQLDSNKLLGTEHALKRIGQHRDFAVQLSGNRQNSYLGAKPCATLENSRIEGGFLFVDDMPCPESYTAATSEPPSPELPSSAPDVTTFSPDK
ncbi:hypothetical protein [Endozoicomonas lisbonensis]|uniref:hypothetical protein n=1 Tax=Endozoicomonas lisbonensis TaxID=3120522 RepID=UPI003395FE0E